MEISNSYSGMEGVYHIASKYSYQTSVVTFFEYFKVMWSSSNKSVNKLDQSLNFKSSTQININQGPS